MKCVYVAGPFRGANAWEIECNIRRAETLALEVWRLGAAAICPHTNTRFFSGAADDSVWLDGDIEILRRCDAVVLTDDWERSSGARAEVSYALQHGIPVCKSITSLAAWLELQVGVDESRTIQRERRDWFDHCERMMTNFFKL